MAPTAPKAGLNDRENLQRYPHMDGGIDGTQMMSMPGIHMPM
jgi:hypothetical protein